MSTHILRSTMVLALGVAGIGLAQQERDRQGERYDHGDTVSRIEIGATVPVRTNESIDSNRQDNRVYYGVVDQDVRGGDGRIAIPRGSQVELMVRVARDSDLVLDLESVTVNGSRYAVRAAANHVEARNQETPLVGAIIGAITGGQASGRFVRIPQGTVLSFRLAQALEVGVPDRGVTRDGRHYHDYYRPQ